MAFPITLTITDDSGFLAVVNADKYNSFVDSEWELSQLFNHFVEEMNKGNLIIWATGYENDWTVSFLDKPSKEIAFREFSKTIHVTKGKLFLTNYEDLTIAAQFADEEIPQKHNAELGVYLDNGEYNFTIRQLFDPEEYDYILQEKINFEVIIQPALEKQAAAIDKIFWWTE